MTCIKISTKIYFDSSSKENKRIRVDDLEEEDIIFYQELNLDEMQKT